MANCQTMEYEYITVELESNSREFMQTKKFPPNRWAKISVNWVEEWRDKDREVVELEFTRIINNGERKDSYSFAFQLASGLTSSLSKTKLWDKHLHRIEGSGWERWQEFKDLHKSRVGHPPPRVVRVVLSVMF